MIGIIILVKKGLNDFVNDWVKLHFKAANPAFKKLELELFSIFSLKLQTIVE